MTAIRPVQESSLHVVTDPPCDLCTALCCKYFALEIDKPTRPEEFDQIRWYLVHQDVVIWVQEGEWYLEVRNRCKHLLPDNRCGIYDTRPDVCRDYGDPEDGPCEFYADTLKFDLYFDSAEAFEPYMAKQLKKRKKRLAKRRAGRKKVKEQV
ncbi:MAG: YkgJ family cysteine cluster protein [Acidobacteria bacterium]|uniref:YkgJ family cysteine cluster protein n=1 Tax=Candidatus Polarisedimenticola svalbardensis TaxID=2886004 RepID=A0A8J7CMB1_9BACT|nr:YkgJ family cysteine cluster protein [Candidatus Polarisedimenticola svalbardensis]